MTLELIQGLLLAFALVVILMPPYIRLLRHFKFGKQIREEGPQSHMIKWGTPTMGGLLIILVVLGIFLLLRWPVQGGVIAPHRHARARRPARRGRRLPQRPDGGGDQGPPEAAVADRRRAVRRVADPEHLPDHRHPGAVRRRRVRRAAGCTSRSAAFAIVAASNGVNITDGLDGLSGGTLAFAFVSFMIIALLNVPSQPNVAFLCALIIGALLGFLWFNVHPAQIIMGDAGSLSLGATLAVIALITGQILVLPLIGLIFVVEAASVIIQVGYFKATGGKRIFRMSPLHHHFELGGWVEEKITLRFWIVGILAGLLGVTLFMASIGGLT